MKWLYYVLQWTWGLLANIVGGLGFIICKCFRRNSGFYRNAVYVTLPWNFGGLSLGMFIFCGKDCLSVRSHEYGHSIQNIIWGPLFIFAIGIPSVVRYWYREWYYKYKYPTTRTSLPDYDSIWFEGDATAKGKQADSGAWSWI